MINEREVKILNYLMSKNYYITGEEIASFIGVSSKTIRADIKNINRRLKDINAQINCARGRGYILEISEKNMFNKELLDLYESSIEGDAVIPTTVEGRVLFIIKKLLMLELKSNEGITQNELCDILYIGLTTLKSDLVTVKKKLKKFNIEILRNGIKGITLSGSEEDLRSCISYYIFKRNENDIIHLDSIKSIFNNDNIEMLQKILIKSINENNITITDISFYNLLIHILIAIERVESNNKVHVGEFAEELIHTSEYEIAQDIVNKIKKDFEIELPKEEVYYITQHLYTRKIINNTNAQLIDKDDEYSKLVYEVLDEIKEVTGIDFKKDETLLWGLTTHLKSAINRIKFDMHITNNFLCEIKKNYSFAYKISSIAGNFIQQKIGKEVNEDEIGFICLHLAASLQRISGFNNHGKSRAIIVCASGMGTSMILSSKIKSKFNDSIEIVAIKPLNELSSIDNNEYDIIISTIKIDSNTYKVNDKPIVYVSPIIKKEDLDSLRQFINTNKRDLLLKFLEFTDEELFYVDTEFQSKEEILDFMLDDMIEKKYLEKEEKQNFFKRENLSSTEIGNFTAIPHAVDTDPKISKISILINKKPVIWQEEKVRLVMLINIEKEFYLEFGEVLEEIYSLICDEEKIVKLLNIKNYKDFIKLMR